MICLAVDPGGTTGYAWAEMHEAGELRVFAWQDPPMDFLSWAHNHIESNPFCEVVVERYTITQKTIKLSRQSDALEVTGALRYLAYLYGDRKIIQQGPSDVMRLFTDDRLKALGWYVPDKEHANDALRHLGYRLAQRKLVPLTPT